LHWAHKRQATTITLPTERASQLRAIAKARGVSLTELVCNYIESEIRAGVIADEIPGFRVTAVKGVIKFEIQDITLTLTTREAAEIADSLGQADPYCRLELENDETLLEIMRRGRGLVVRFCGHDELKQWYRKGLSRSTIPWFRRGLSLSTARDLAKLFETALIP